MNSRIFCLIFRECRESSESTIKSSCNCFEWHIVMQNCPVANYHYVHNLWQSVRRDSKHFYVLFIFWKWQHFRANYKQGINSSYNSIKFCINKAKIKILIFAMYQNYPLALTNSQYCGSYQTTHFTKFALIKDAFLLNLVIGIYLLHTCISYV